MPSELLPGENLVLKAHQHWIVIVKSLVIPVVLLVIAGILDLFVQSGTVIPHFPTIISLAAIAIAGAWLTVAWGRCKSSPYALTDRRTKPETGASARSSMSTP